VARVLLIIRREHMNKEENVDKDMDVVNEKITKAIKDADLTSMKFGESRTISLSGLFDEIAMDDEESIV